MLHPAMPTRIAPATAPYRPAVSPRACSSAAM